MIQSKSLVKRIINFFFLAPALFFLALWMNINTGPWDMESPHGMIGYLNAFRASLPYIILPLAVVLTLSRCVEYPLPIWMPSQLLTFFGIVVLISTVFSPIFMISFYWGIAFLAVSYAAKLVARQYNLTYTYRYWIYETWIVTTLLACILIYMGRHALAVSSESAYGINTTLNNASRSSGVARFAAVPGIIALCRVITDRGWRKIFWGLLTIFFLYIVYKCQSRGAIFSTLVALPLVFVAGVGRVKTMVLGACLVIAVMIFDPNMILIQKFKKHIQRGQTEEQLESMTGRTRPWKNAMVVFANSPILLGQGNWTDRAILKEHAHNAFVQALLNGGLLGIIFYTGSWIAGWYLFFKIITRIKDLPELDRKLFLECAAVMTFFFIRSIPETTTASYAVDLVIMVPVFCYMEFLYARLTGGYQDETEGNVKRLILKPIGRTV